ncbi:non-ribosomal peptide synthetase [Algoriphagus sp. AK58]|uniref:non-ribosomal peptide synthetase n=1 Tax=Algoriphagus sp. AK58 TaxID=1406877 RepID=UPI0016504B5E|nr:non-ribosomal peptide synthetase [Algoriphagus sp. AK58]MBC6366467.1 hypothetical protein [Algoriphagus sp. AK58]
MAPKDLSPAKRELLEKWMKGKLPDSEKTGLARRPSGNLVKLSFPQQRQLFLELLERGTAVNNLSVLLKLEGGLDVSALEKSANLIVERHENLRTGFVFELGLPSAKIWDQLSISIPLVDLQHFDQAKRQSEVRRLAESEVLKPFDLSIAPLIRIKLFQTGEQEYYFLVVVHHTIADGWSLGVFLKELMFFYQRSKSGQSIILPELPIQYADYAFWQTSEERQREFETSLTYWVKSLAGDLPVLELPTDKRRGSRQTFSGGTHRFVLSEELTKSLEDFGRAEDSTLFMTLLTAYFLLLYRYSGQNEILIGTPIANRNLPEIQDLIGVFINTLVLRIYTSGDQGFRELLRQVRTTALESFAHQDLPFEKLVETLKPRRDLSRPPLFQVVFNFQNAPLPKLEIEGIKSTFQEIDRGVSQFDLTLLMAKVNGQCQATVEYNSDLFRSSTIERMFKSYQLILEQALLDPECPVSLYPLLLPEEINRLVHDRNQTFLEFPKDLCIHQLFENQAEKTPDALAVMDDQRQLTYFELNQHANTLAMKLQELGVGPGVRVGVLMKRSWEIPAVLLAIHKAGGAYVPIHTGFPLMRIEFILKDAEVKVLFTNLDTDLADQLAVPKIKLNEEKFSPAEHLSNPNPKAGPDHLAYLIYTSGSTGTPKGVMINHSSLVNFLWSMQQKPGIKTKDVLLAVTALSFDIAALEFFLPLIAGASLLVASEDRLLNPNLLAEAIDQFGVTVLQATPAMWQILLDTGWKGNSGLKALCGGEALSERLADQILDKVGSLWNMYGPTETTIWSSVQSVKKGKGPITIGEPIGNTQLYILDDHHQPVPVNVVGELLIGGQGLAQGYLNLPHLTEEKFVWISIYGQPKTRLYRTGDLARYLEDGSIEVLGRMDSQLKIHGNRIELGEITSVLLKHPRVQDGIVISNSDSLGAKKLVAYFVPKQNLTAPNSDELREFLGNQLPEYMIPAFFIPISSLPLSTNGKIDRKALPIPENKRQFSQYLAPGNETEQLLVEIWQNVLNLDRVGIQDNFFDLGGASMQSLQLVAKANMFGLKISVENIFEFQTIKELSEHVRAIGQK